VTIKVDVDYYFPTFKNSKISPILYRKSKKQIYLKLSLVL